MSSWIIVRSCKSGRSNNAKKIYLTNLRVIFGPLLFVSVSSKTYLCLANKSIKVNSFWSAFLWGRFFILFSVLLYEWYALNATYHYFIFFILCAHSPSCQISYFFQCSVFTCTFYATIFSDFFFFSAQCSHIPADISLCGPRGRSPNNRLWFRLPGKTLTQLAHDYVNQVFLLIVLKFKIGWKLYFKVTTNNLFSP